MTPEITKSDQEWKEGLSPEQYAVLRQSATEPPFTGKYVHNHDDGTYRCAACGAVLFSSETKFDSGTGWPSFWEPEKDDSVELRPDKGHGMVRGRVRQVRVAPGTRVSRRTCSDGRALLHQLPGAGVRALRGRPTSGLTPGPGPLSCPVRPISAFVAADGAI